MMQHTTFVATYQDMPHVLIGSLKAAEANGDTEQALTPPQVAWGHRGLPQLQSLWGVN